MSAIALRMIDGVHERYVVERRVRVIAHHLSRLVPQGSDVLDVGAGAGTIALSLMRQRPDIRVRGIDVLVRPGTHIPVREFDGSRIPEADRSVDTILLVDVLHHTDDPVSLLREAARVAREAVVIKDHVLDGWLASQTLRFMDRTGNERHGVRLPYNYLTLQQWKVAFEDAGLRVDADVRRLGLYPPPASWVFDRQLHFAARLVHC